MTTGFAVQLRLRTWFYVYHACYRESLGFPFYLTHLSMAG
jgi:hypothetical protein